MPVTVRDCLSLPVFKDCVIVSGESSLDNVVKAVSVIETTNLDEMLFDHVKGNEILISAFFDVKDDVIKQCKLIEGIAKAKEAALVLYYVGVLMPQLHPDVIHTAEKLNFPVIVMPNDYNLSYADTITSVMELIIHDNIYPTFVRNEIMLELSGIEEENQNIKYVMELFSKKLRCGFAVYDTMQHFIHRIHVSENIFSVLDENVRRNNIQNAWANMPKNGNRTFTLHYHEKEIPVHFYRFSSAGNVPMLIYILDYEKSISHMMMEQIIDTVRLSEQFWRSKKYDTDSDSLLQSMIHNESMTAQLIAKKLHVNLSELQGFVLMKAKNEAEKLPKLSMEDYSDRFKILWSERENEKLYVFFKKINLSDKEFTETVTSICDFLDSSKDKNIIYYVHFEPAINSLNKFSQMYKNIQEYSWVLPVVFPYRRVLRQPQWLIPAMCKELLKSEVLGHEISKELLEPILNHSDSSLVDTMATFFLDADMNIQKTAKLLFLHSNTVKYRLNKVNALLNMDIMNMSYSPMVILALASYRTGKS